MDNKKQMEMLESLIKKYFCQENNSLARNIILKKLNARNHIPIWKFAFLANNAMHARKMDHRHPTRTDFLN